MTVPGDHHDGRGPVRSVGASTVTASRPRAFVFGARGHATDGEWRWFPAIRWFAPDGRLVQTRVLGGYGGTWAMAATRAWHGAYMENLRLHIAQQARPPR